MAVPPSPPGDRTSKFKSPLCRPFSPCLISPRPPRPMTARVRETTTPGPTFPTRNFELCHRFFINVHFQLMCKDKRDKTRGLTKPPNSDHLNREKVLVTASMISPVSLRAWLVVRVLKVFRDGPLEKLWGGGGEFSRRRNFFVIKFLV